MSSLPTRTNEKQSESGLFKLLLEGFVFLFKIHESLLLFLPQFSLSFVFPFKLFLGILPFFGRASLFGLFGSAPRHGSEYKGLVTKGNHDPA